MMIAKASGKAVSSPSPPKMSQVSLPSQTGAIEFMALYANLSDRARARHGAQRVLRLHRCLDDEIYLAAGARRGVLLGRDLLFHLDLPHSRIHHQCDPAEPETGDIGRRRAVPWHHCA